MKRWIGNKAFYKMVLAIAVPIMIQNGITNFVSLLDNIMVGQIGTEQMSGVAIVNQLVFVFNICIFGAVSGAGIFGAQFFGRGDYEGAKHAFRIKLFICAGMTIIALLILIFRGDMLIMRYLHEGSDSGNIADTLQYASKYLAWIMIGLLPFALEQSYASTLRENGETLLPMKAGIVAVFINLILNYLLIFGKFGFPKLGVEGAAIATVISRFIECAVIVSWTHKNSAKQKFITGAYRSIYVPGSLMKQVFIKGTPLTLNEILWSVGQTVLIQCYSVRGLAVIAGFNISSTISNVFNIVFIALGGSVAVIIGQLLGADKMEEAKDTAGKMIFFSVVSCFVMGILMIIFAPVFPEMYQTTDQIKSLASTFIIVAAVFMPLNAFTHACYFILRSGGKTAVTFLFDSCFTWLVSIPIVYFLTNYTPLPITVIYTLCMSAEILKCLLGFILIKKGIWLQNIVKLERNSLLKNT